MSEDQEKHAYFVLYTSVLNGILMGRTLDELRKYRELISIADKIVAAVLNDKGEIK